ncbi:MAG: DUF4869 domain-containing protein [Lachnospiraceae bacterium]|nr:DUF4869 domain-containing protein [Lachnospiraceae bacterium]
MDNYTTLKYLCKYQIFISTPIFYVNKQGWFTTDFERKVLADIEKADIINESTFNSPIYGALPMDRLSTGTKSVIIANRFPDKIVNATQCGNNCAKWFLEMSRDKDVTIQLDHLMDFGKENFEIL